MQQTVKLLTFFPLLLPVWEKEPYTCEAVFSMGKIASQKSELTIRRLNDNAKPHEL